MLIMTAIDPDTERAVRGFVGRIPSDLRMERAVLFGSRARGDYGPDSDADVALIFPDGADVWGLLWMLSGLAYDVFVETGIMIQPVPVSSRDWADPEHFSRPSFLRNVAREGIEV
jgi:predicted nucleotidyltransferase